ncbi:MAG: cell division protein FtsQ/DivIB [Betaproteobacteria bacterium]|nr:cell division protein FtsQ/DivIB [Betaproteobacteria bacterium]
MSAAARPLPLDIRLMRVTANLLMALSLAAFVVLGVQWLANRGVFAIQRLRVTGSLEHVNPITLRAQVVGNIAGTFFTVDVTRARQVFEQLPWVRRASVSRLWPDGLRVDLHEHHPVALWGREGSEKLLNSHGEVFDANPDEVDADLPRLNGPADSGPRVLTMYTQLAQRLSNTDDRLAVLELNARQEWRAQLDSGLVLMLGRDDGDFWSRLDQFLLTATQARAQTQKVFGSQAWTRVDLRNSQGYAVSLRQEAGDGVQKSTRNGD